MLQREFDKLLDNIIEETKRTLANKADEYASSKDRLHNFKFAAKLESTCPEKALRGMMTKHVVSVYDMIDAVNRGKVFPPEYAGEKLGDMRNYCILLEALLLERWEGSLEKSAEELGLT